MNNALKKAARQFCLFLYQKHIQPCLFMLDNQYLVYEQSHCRNFECDKLHHLLNRRHDIFDGHASNAKVDAVL